MNEAHETKYYFRATKDELKTRYNDHKKSFTNKETKLLKDIWYLKDKQNFTITWGNSEVYIKYTLKYFCQLLKYQSNFFNSVNALISCIFIQKM